MIFLEYNDAGLITNAIVYDGEEPYTPPDGLSLVERGDSEAWIGWTYDGETFIPPPYPGVEYELSTGLVVRILPVELLDDYETPEGMGIKRSDEVSPNLVGWTFHPQYDLFTPPN